MTNEDLLKKGRALKIDNNDEWLVPDRILLVCRPSANDENVPDKYALLFHENVRVGIVYFMGSYDIHWLIFPEHRSKGYMSHFVRSGVIKLVEPELRMSLVDPFHTEGFEESRHLVELAGLRCCQSEKEREEFRRQIYDKQRERLNALCSCGSGKKHKYCCQNVDNRLSDDDQPCWECEAYKSHTTATRCWKCGADYEDY